MMKSLSASIAGSSGHSSRCTLSPSGNRVPHTSSAVNTSTGAATIKIQVSNDGANWLDLGTITLTLGTVATADGFASYAAWAYVRANVTVISGTNASVTVTMAV